MTLPARRLELRRGDLDPGRQVDRDLRRGLRDRAGADGGRAQAARPLPGPLRAQPGRPLRAAAAARRRGEAGRQGGLQPDNAVPLLCALAPALVIFSGVATLAIIPFGNVKDGVGLYGIDVSIGVLYFFAFGSIALLRPAARRLGLGLEVQLPRRDALGGAADLLRGLDGPGAARRDHDGRVAVAGRDRRGPGRDLVRRSRSSSAS